VANYNDERAHVEKLLALTNIDAAPKLEDPNDSGREETGADVAYITLAGRVGIQVTEYTVDEASENKPKEHSRAKEKRLAHAAAKEPGPVKAYGMASASDYAKGLGERIRIKALKSMGNFVEKWLLVATQIRSAPSSTFFSAEHVLMPELDDKLIPLLEGSQYDRVLVLLSLEEVVFQWRPKRTWEKIADNRQPVSPARIEELRKKLKLS
jgi:hypothetical protein